MSRIERYAPEQLLGTSGLVDTFRVRVAGQSEPAALKVAFVERAEKGLARELAARFLAAGRRSQAFHLGAAQVLEVSDDVEAAFVATEWVAGGDLTQLLQRLGTPKADLRPVDPRLAAAVCAEVAATVAAAHACLPALHHLGLSPGNVVVTAAGVVKVLDFGLSASVRRPDLCPLEKWHFVAPELLGRDASSISAEAAKAADRYSVGALLCFLLSGGARPEGGSLQELSGRVRRPPVLPEGTPAGIRQAGHALTALEPSARPGSLEPIIELLRKEIGSEPQRYLADQIGGATTKSGKTQQEAPMARPVPGADAPPGQVPTVHAGSKHGNARRDVPPVHRFAGRRAALAGLATLLLVLLGLLVHQGLRRGLNGPHHLPDPMAVARIPDQPPGPGATPQDGGASAPTPELLPAAHGYVPDPDHPPTRVPGRVFLDTSPQGADIWIDGILRGQTPVDIVTGPGAHRMVAIKAGYLMWRAVYDTSRGEFARRELQPTTPPTFGNAFLDVRCPATNRFPVILDDEETGLLCPVRQLPVASGKHSVGIFVPLRRANVTVEVDVAPGRQATRVDLKD